jgi:hypothetical protein
VNRDYAALKRNLDWNIERAALKRKCDWLSTTGHFSSSGGGDSSGLSLTGPFLQTI